jgi:hypothetical protein
MYFAGVQRDGAKYETGHEEDHDGLQKEEEGANGRTSSYECAA